MTPEQFAQTYLRYEADIIAVLKSKRIFNEDLLHDIYIALCERTPHPEPCDFLKTFVSFYRNLMDWQNNRDSHFVPYDNAQLAALDIIDDSVGEDALDEHLDRSNRTSYREQCLERLPEVLDYYFAHPQPGERNHRRACRILRLYLRGLSECEISRQLSISQQAVQQSLTRTIERLKVVPLILYNRGA